MRKQLAIAAAVLGAGAAIGAGLVFLRDEPPASEPPQKPPVVQTAPAEARTGPLQVTGSGTVRPRAEVALAAQVSGRAEWVSAKLVSGGRVRAGEVLVRIDAADYANQVRQARAAVRQAEVELQRTEEEARLARREYARFQARERDRLGPPAGVDPDDYASRFVPPQGAPQAQQDQGEVAEPGGLLFRGPQLQAARAGLDRARAQLEQAQIALRRTRVTAPFDAVVRAEQVDRGALVQPGQQLAVLYASDALEVTVPLPDASAALIPGLRRLGQGGPQPPARVEIEHGPATFAWSGRVDRLEGAVDERTRTLNVVVQVPRPFDGGRAVGETADGPAREAPPLLPGQFARVRIQGAAPGRYFAVPRTALRDEDQVWTVVDGRLRKLAVRVLQTVDETVLIQAPLQPGQPVVVNDLAGAVEGMQVRTPRAGGA